jgi:hypothetical protein
MYECNAKREKVEKSVKEKNDSLNGDGKFGSLKV